MFLKRSLVLFFLVFPIFGFGKTLRVGLGSPPNTFDWNAKNSLVDAALIVNLEEGLFRYDESGALVLGLAESFKRSKDLTEYTFTIRKNAKWSDGRPVFAQDFVYGWTRVLSPQSTSNYLFYLFDILNASEFRNGKVAASAVGVIAVDDRTVKVKLKAPVDGWEYVTAFWPTFPVRKDAIEAHGANWSRPGILLSTGPFVLESFESAQKIILSRNKYYPSNTNIDRIELSFNSDFEALFTDYQKDKLDVLLEIPHGKLEALRVRKDFRSRMGKQLIYLGLNTNHFPMNAQKFRQALLLSLDQNKLMPKANGYKPVNNLIEKPKFGSNQNVVLSQNINGAKKLISDSAIFIEPKLKIKLLTFAREPFQTVGKLIEQQWVKNLGLNVELITLDPSELTTFTSLGSYSAIVQAWTAKMNNVQDFLNPFSSANKQNLLGLNDVKFDQLLKNASVLSGKKKNEAIIKAQKYLVQEKAVYLPLFYEADSYLIKNPIKQLYLNHIGLAQFRDVIL